MDNKEIPVRKRNRLVNYDYSSCGAYFITICTDSKKHLLWDKNTPDFVGEDIILPLSHYGKIAEAAIKAIPEYYPHIEVQQYVIMPNHIHMILLIPYESGRIISSPTSRHADISTVVGQMKRYVSKKAGTVIWQRSFHDHIIRDGNDYEKISEYMFNNPINWEYDCFYTAES